MDRTSIRLLIVAIAILITTEYAQGQGIISKAFAYLDCLSSPFYLQKNAKQAFLNVLEEKYFF